VALIGLCTGLLSGCNTNGPNRLHVQIAKGAVLPPMVGHTVYCGVIDLLAAPGAETLGGGHEVLRTLDESTLVPILANPNPSGHDMWEGTAGTTYGLEVWVDLNDNYPSTMTPPESGIDYVTSPARLQFVLDAGPEGTVFVINQFVRAP
jgi:hypothetical protein